MIIDGHIHLGGMFFDFKNLIASMDKAGVDKCIVVPFMFKDNTIYKHYLLPPWVVSNNLVHRFTPQLLRLSRVRNRYVLRPNNNLTRKLIEKYPEKFFGFYWVNPNIPEDIREMERCLRKGEFVGVKLHQVIHSFQIDSQGVEQVLDITEKHKIPLFIHVDKKRDLERLLLKARQRPDTTFIIAHLDYYPLWLNNENYPDNIYYDISPITKPKLVKIKEIIRKKSSEQLVFGTDSPYPGGQDYAVKKLLELKLSQRDYENMFCFNYKKIFPKLVLTNTELN